MAQLQVVSGSGANVMNASPSRGKIGSETTNSVGPKAMGVIATTITLIGGATSTGRAVAIYHPRVRDHAAVASVTDVDREAVPLTGAEKEGSGEDCPNPRRDYCTVT